jgi:hypothetical protein
MKKTFIPYLMLSIVLGLAIAWIDSRPTWDDSGISAFMLAVAATLCAYFASQKPWLIALAISIWIPLISIFSTHNFGGFLAFIPAFAGAFAGYWLRVGLSRP